MDATFTPFPRLPLDLRSKIWRCSLPLFPRIVEVKSMKSTNGHDKHARPRWLATTNSEPILLSVNRESRSVLLPYYSAPFQSRMVSPHLGVESLLLSYHVDTLFINAKFRLSCYSDILFRDIFGSNFVEVQDNLKRLACTEDFWITMLQQIGARRSGNNRSELLDGFTSLEVAMLVSETDSLDLAVSSRLSHFVDSPEGGEVWRHLEREQHSTSTWQRRSYTSILRAKFIA